MEYFRISRLGTILAPWCVNFRTDHTRLKQKTLSSWTAVQLTEWATNVAHLPLKVKCSMVQGITKKIASDNNQICLTETSLHLLLGAKELHGVPIFNLRHEWLAITIILSLFSSQG